ncbi:MAG TPA: GNAT family N-acetyltransferase [Labilithrix sp.]|nr:GNAT family N-acetyltransferase [Labilithrix sp.]
MHVIRKATREDVPAILGLVRELAAYEKEPDAVVATEADFLRDGFGERPAFEVLVAEDAESGGAGSGRVVGFAFYFFSYSTWVGRKCLYLEDLFVQPSHRGRGTGIALMRALAKVAVERDCRRFVWAVLDWNEPAIGFYERLGAKVMREWLTVRLEGEALTRLSC